MYLYTLGASGGLAILCAVLMVFQRSLYASAICLMGVLLQIAVLYFLLGAELLSLLQVLIYAGAVMVLIVLAIMASPPRLARLWAEFHLPRWLVGGVLAVAALELGMLLKMGASSSAAPAPINRALEREMAALLFGRYALMTEAVGLIILVSALSMLQDQELP